MGGSGNDEAGAVTVDPAGHVDITGGFTGVGDFDNRKPHTLTAANHGGEDIFLAKLDSSGSLLWVRTAGGAGNDVGKAIRADSQGNVIVAGNFHGVVGFDPSAGAVGLASAGGTDGFVWKLSGAGSFVMARSVGGVNEDSVNGLAIDAGGNPILTGSFTGIENFSPLAGNRVGSDSAAGLSTGAGQRDAFVEKLSPSGSLVWARRFGGKSDDQSLAVATDAAGRIYVAGSFTGVVDFDPNAGVYNLKSAWTPVAGSARYVLQASNDGGKTFTPVASHPPGTTSYTVTGLPAGSKNWYRVLATNDGGTSPAATPILVTMAPPAPSDVLATAISTTQIDVTWAATASNAGGYRIERSADGIHLTPAGTTAAGITRLSDRGLTATTMPVAPSALVAGVISPTQINLSWGEVAGETGYILQRSTDGTTFSNLVTLPADTTVYHDTALKAGSTYDYRILSFNSGGQSAPSNIAVATTIPSAPTGASATTISAQQINIAWTDGDGESAYLVERSTDGILCHRTFRQWHHHGTDPRLRGSLHRVWPDQHGGLLAERRQRCDHVDRHSRFCHRRLRP